MHQPWDELNEHQLLWSVFFREPTVYDFGSGGESLSYPTCFCKRKFELGNHNALIHYLKTQCKGWTSDPQNKYTVNYIVYILLANFKSKRLFKQGSRVVCDGPLRSVFGLSSFRINTLRSLVYWFITGEAKEPPCLFLCVPEQMVVDIFGPGMFKSDIKKYARQDCIANQAIGHV